MFDTKITFLLELAYSIESRHAQLSSFSVTSSLLSCAAVAKGATGQADPKKDDKTVSARKANKLENLLATLDDTNLSERISSHSWTNCGKISEIPANQELAWTQQWPSRRKPRPKLPAAKSTRLAREERAAADSELKAARSSVAFLPAAQEAQEQQELEEGAGKRPRVGPYGAETKFPREIAQLANPALVNKLAASVAYIQRHMQPPWGENVGVALASEVAAQLDFQKAQGSPPPREEANKRMLRCGKMHRSLHGRLD